MLKHVLLLKIKDCTPELAQKTKEIFLSMQGNVPMVRNVESGVDVLHSERSFDVALTVTLDDLDALEAYQQDKYHCEVVKTFIHSVRENTVVVDYEV